jgi:hypothetical protein
MNNKKGKKIGSLSSGLALIVNKSGSTKETCCLISRHEGKLFVNKI